MGFSSRSQGRSPELEVDYDKGLYLPKGASYVLTDHPNGKGKRIILPAEFDFALIPRDQTGREFIKQSGAVDFCDARILDAMVEEVLREKTKDALSPLVGKHEIIYFFGTLFRGLDGKDLVAFLNLSTSPFLPSLRYVYSMDQLIDSHIPCYAGLLRILQ